MKQIKDSALDSFKYLIRSSYFPFFIRMLFIDFKFVIPDDTINHFETPGLKTQKILKTLFRPAFIKSTLSYVIFSNRHFILHLDHLLPQTYFVSSVPSYF